ncbi:hypothetical protein DFJ58DRAFT_130308 [Suillus subalutaceus]|uniref:uncharacterized protein n=1 Tax=Suillus subalutaceus TaxID=48586 RepID=UPI001B8628A1|nr:uncharacterized protein DFJ58DRAFT_130308 [Suillus subalutaceus]KAG1867284.1 hypothetical protein DFJ58DRAFT_130308 [Suillus subalutaceus]
MSLNSKDTLLKALQLSPDLNDEAIGRDISAIITVAVDDETHQPSLKTVYDNILQYNGGPALLEPLDVLPDLLRCHRKEAVDLISLISENSSPKEVLIVIQETLEQLTQLAREDEDEDEDEAEEEHVPGSVQCLINVIMLSTKSVPRLTLGKRTALSVVSPLVSGVSLAVSSLGSHFTRDSGRSLLAGVSGMSEAFYTWIFKTGSEANIAEARKIIRLLLDTTVLACAPCIRASLCARAFEMHYPRLTLSSAIEPEWQEGEQAILSVLTTLRVMTLSPQDVLDNPTMSSLVILAHEQQNYPLPKDLSSKLHSMLMTSIQMNFALDESLFLIFRCVTQDRTQPEPDFPPDLATSLCIVLPALASTHLDPFVRHFSLRLIALILAQLPSVLQQQILITLASDTEFPQMRAAAIGLLKGFVLEALQVPTPSGEPNVFASPLLIRSFGPILFRTMPSDYLSTVQVAGDIEKSLEPSRIAEVLSFYYVLLQRDRDNKTGIRDPDNIASVESSLLRPLRSFLEKWSNAKPVLSLISLQIGLERIDYAKTMLYRSSEAGNYVTH